MAEPLVTFHDASRRLGCSIRHAQRLIQEGRLRSVRDARGIEFLVGASLTAYETARAGAFAFRANRPDPPGRLPDPPA